MTLESIIIGDADILTVDEQIASTVEVLGEETVSITEETVEVISISSSGPKGDKGDRGEKGDAGIVKISTDQNNLISEGSDAGLYVPESTLDPLAYYILAKS